MSTSDTSLSPAPSDALTPSVVSEMAFSPGNFRFFPLVRFLERLSPEAPAVGGDGPFEREAVRFRSRADLAFHPNEIVKIDTNSNAEKYTEITTSFLGTSGVSSPLPTYLLEELTTDDEFSTRQRDFLGIFHHRLLGLFYRSVARLSYPEEFSSEATDPWSTRILALAGLSEHRVSECKSLSRRNLLQLAVLLCSGTRSLEVLEIAMRTILGTALQGAKIELIPYTGSWTRLGTDQQATLGKANHQIGMDFVLGDRCFDRASQAKMQITGLTDVNFRRFLGDGDLFPVVVDVLKLFTTDPVDFELELVLDNKMRPTFSLGSKSGGTLGEDAWLPARDDTQSRINIDLPTI